MQEKQEIPPIIFFAGCDWWYQNRGLFVAQIASRLGARHKVLFINSLGMRIPSLKSDKNAIEKIKRKLASMFRYLKKDSCGMYVFTPLSIPFQNKIGKSINQLFLSFQIWLVMKYLSIKNPIYYIGCPPAFEVIKKYKRSLLIYERTDIFEEMSGADQEYIAHLNQQLIESSDLVLYVNRELMKEGQKIRNNGFLIGHGVDYKRFAFAHKNPHIPKDIQNIPKPIAGFFGDLNKDWVDFDLLEYAARELSEISFVLIGPISSDIEQFEELQNVFFLGKKPYPEIPDYGKYFDVALLPWRKTRWIEYCNPVKTKEYLALGVPVVSVNYPELEPFLEVVYQSSTKEDFVKAIEQAVVENDSELVRKRKFSVEQETWDQKVRMLEENIRINLNKDK